VILAFLAPCSALAPFLAPRAMHKSSMVVHSAPPPRSTHMQRRALVLSATSALLLGGLQQRAYAATSPSFERLFGEAALAFQRADYAGAERLWKKATDEYPSQPLAHANLAVVLIINASDECTLGEPPTGGARTRLEEALAAIDTAESLGSAPDALNLNAKGNAFGLLLKWSEAAGAYRESAAAAPRDFESIPRSNEACDTPESNPWF